jgi:uncharacterized membrane protein (TIGR02234 family)
VAAVTGRELSVTVSVCLVGAALVLASTSSTWAEALVDPGAPFPPSEQTLSGGDAVPAVPALGLVGLAAVAALLAARGLARLAVGAVLVLTGGALAVLAARPATDPSTAARAVVAANPGLVEGAVREVGVTPWPWLAVAGGVLLALAGALTVVRGPAWAALSARYDAPGAERGASGARTAGAPRDPDVVHWEALDRGEDPTA